jgi:hypothetical protein
MANTVVQVAIFYYSHKMKQLFSFVFFTKNLASSPEQIIDEKN